MFNEYVDIPTERSYNYSFCVIFAANSVTAWNTSTITNAMRAPNNYTSSAKIKRLIFTVNSLNVSYNIADPLDVASTLRIVSTPALVKLGDTNSYASAAPIVRIPLGTTRNQSTLGGVPVTLVYAVTTTPVVGTISFAIQDLSGTVISSSVSGCMSFTVTEVVSQY